MKYKRIFSILALSIVFSLLVVAIPAIPTYAVTGDEEISLSPDDGEIDEEIDIDGYDFETDEDIDIYFTSEDVDEGDDIDDLDVYELVESDTTDGDGEFSTSFDVPDELTGGDEEEDVSSGDYYVFVTYDGDDEIVAVDSFEVIGGEITISPKKGPVGTKVRITGEGFGSKDDITIEYDGDDVDIESGDDETDSDGDFTCTIVIPESPEGDHTITVQDDSDNEAEAEFTVEPKMVISPTEGSPGTKVTVTGTGFSKNEDITIIFNDSGIAADDVDSDGSFTITFNVPAIGPGEYTVEAEDGDGNTDSAQFTLAISISFSPSTGNVGTPLTISGTGFIAGKTVAIKYDDTQITTATVASGGTFTATFNAPASKGGSHTITATDGTSTLTATFTMESTQPPVPGLQLPEQDTKAEAEETYFDWNDVDDPSGVTYSFQLATDKNFSKGSIVLEKSGLTESEYTTTAEDGKLESTKKEAPYYWRVKAIDGAGNESQWTTPGSFRVGFTFDLNGWALYAVIGIAGLLFLLIIVYLLVRRTAAY